MTGTIAKLGDFFLDGSGPIGWELRPGIRPSRTVISIERSAGEALYNLGPVPLDLVMGPRTIKNVYITSTTAASAPEFIGLVIEDFRWRWAYKSVVSRYNVKERTGFIRLLSAGGQTPEANRVLAPRLRYKPSTLKNRKDVFSIEDAILDTFNQAGEAIKVGNVARAVELEDFDEADFFPSVLEAFKAQLGGYDFKALDDGTAELYDLLDKSEGFEIKKDDEVRYLDSGHVEVARRSHERPSAIDFYFAVMPELRFDFKNEDAAGISLEDGREPRLLENITPSPVREMSIDTTDGKRVVAEGTPITFPQLYAALPSAISLPLNASSIGHLTEEIVLRRYLGRGGWSLKYRYQRGATPDDEYRKVIAAVMKNWHRLFRITRPWRNRIKSIFPYRANVLDFTTKSRAKAQVWTDYTEVPSRRNWYQMKFSRDELNHELIVEGYADKLEDGTLAESVDFTVKDQDGGIIRIFLDRDNWGDVDRIIPGVVETRTSVAETNALFAVLAQRPLKKGWKLATVFSVLVEPEFGLKSYKKVTVTPDQAEAVLGAGTFGSSKGPRMSVIIPVDREGIFAARYYWRDDDAAAIDEFFFSGKELPDFLLLNQPHIEQIALGEAARIYSSLMDRPEGSYAADIGPNTNITGAITSVSMQLAPNGELSKSVFLNRLEEQVDALAFTNQITRREITGNIEI